MKKGLSRLWVAAAAAASLAGFGFFALVFIPHMNVYIFILSPILLAVHQIPAAVIFALWKRRRRREAAAKEEKEKNSPEEPPLS